MSALAYIPTRSGPVAVRQTQGTGLPILMLHGVGFSSAVFARQLESPLAGMFRLIAVDLPGHGESVKPDDPEFDYSISASADLVAELIGELGLSQALVLGWSLGGHIAFELMGRYPERLAGVLACGAPPIGRGLFAAMRGFQLHWELLLASKAHYSRAEAERFARFCLGDAAGPEYVETVLDANGPLRPNVNRSIMHGEGLDQRAVVETSPVPLAIVNGTDDPVVRRSYVTGLRYANLWERTCHLIPGAGHVPFLTAPNAFNALLHRFATEMGLRAGTTRREAIRLMRSA